MKGLDFANYMTLEEWKQWERNVNKYNLSTTPKELLMTEYKSFNLFILNSFFFIRTEQGGCYWYEISDRINPLK